MASPRMVKEQLSRHETAVQEVTRGYDLTTQLQSLLELSRPHGDHGGSFELAGGLLAEVLQALSASLSILNSCSASPVGNQGSDVSPKPRLKNGRKEGRKSNQSSWTRVTSTPFVDGHQWRKYGEKKIQNSMYPRCYYRCTHKDVQKCPATKIVEQRDNEDPPMFVVTYNMQHTCKGKFLEPNLIVDSPSTESGSLSFDSSTLESKQQHFLLSPPSSRDLECHGKMGDWHKNTCSTSNHPIALDESAMQEPLFTGEYNSYGHSITSFPSSEQEWDVDFFMAD